MDDVGLFEVNHDVTAGVRRAEIARADLFGPIILPPGVGKGGVGQGRRRTVRIILGRHQHERGHIGVRHDGLGHGLERAIAPGVVAVVMRVDHGIELPVISPRQLLQENRGGVRELRIHRDQRLGGGEPTDAAAAAREDADVAAQRPEVRHHGRRLDRDRGGGWREGRGGLGAQGALREEAQRGGHPGFEEEITAVHVL